jgi:hypothetical protein
MEGLEFPLMVCIASATNVHAQQQNGWSAAGSLGTARFFGHTATLLANGKVLVVGGTDFLNPCCRNLGSAELYDPASGEWSVTGSLSTGRVGHIAVRLTNGKVLVAGGYSGPTLSIAEMSAEIYDPDSGAWSAAGSLNLGRAWPRATLLLDGRVLITAGTSGGFLGSETAELYEPRTQDIEISFFAPLKLTAHP